MKDEDVSEMLFGAGSGLITRRGIRNNPDPLFSRKSTMRINQQVLDGQGNSCEIASG